MLRGEMSVKKAAVYSVAQLATGAIAAKTLWPN
jgi:hypothetical protein